MKPKWAFDYLQEEIADHFFLPQVDPGIILQYERNYPNVHVTLVSSLDIVKLAN